uniref:NAD(P)H-binding protein n=1 Tax=Nocardiopsis gilva TaxID=280236 RepID=UPI000686F0A5|nr:NAD(P)H-binding protein [Nocardiopsis gilva]
MIVVSGASGQLGRRTVELLKERGDASSIVALSRTPEKIADLGVTARAADFDDPHSLVKAFDGAERLLIISTDQLDGEGTRVRQHGNAIEAAAKAGVGHVLYTSIVEASAQGNPSLLVPDHLATEKLLAESGLAYTVLRNSLYSELPVGTCGGRLGRAGGQQR